MTEENRNLLRIVILGRHGQVRQALLVSFHAQCSFPKRRRIAVPPAQPRLAADVPLLIPKRKSIRKKCFRAFQKDLGSTIGLRALSAGRTKTIWGKSLRQIQVWFESPLSW